MNRRSMMKLTGAAIVGAGVLTETACDKKDVEFYVVTITGSLEQLKPLLPNQSDLLTKGISIAKAFNSAYQAGKFDSALELFDNMVSVIDEVIKAAGITPSTSVQMALAAASIGIRGLAILMRHETNQSPVAVAVVKQQATVNAVVAKRVSLVESLSSPTAVNAIFAAVRP